MEEVVDQVAQKYLNHVTIKADFVSAACPFHKGGQERNPSFWVSRTSGAWGCFACSESGGGLKWLLKKLGVHSASINAHLEEAERQAKKNEGLRKLQAQKKARKSFKGEHTLPDALLGVFDWLPVDLVEQGFREKVLRDHDIGFDRRNERITFPIRDLYGNLIGISGRDTLGQEPKYLVYNGRRVIDGKEVLGELGEWYPGYSNEGVRDHLWRMDKCYETLRKAKDGQLIIVEGYKAALWLVQHGWTQTVALMGARMSPAQERIVRSLGCETFVLLDNNYAGIEGSKKICQRLAVSSFPVYCCHYSDEFIEGAQPDDLDEEGLDEILSTSQRVGAKEHVRKRLRQLGRKSRGRFKEQPWKKR